MYQNGYELFGIDNDKTAVELIKAEVERTSRSFPPFASPHEAFAVLLEGVDLLKLQVFSKPGQRNGDGMRIAAIIVAAIAARLADEVCHK